MIETVTLSTLVADKVAKWIASKAFVSLTDQIAEEFARLREFFEDLVRADLNAAIQLTRDAVLLEDEENRRHHLNLAIMEFNKALHRLQSIESSRLELISVHFGKLIAYVMLQEAPKAADESSLIEQLYLDYEAELRSFLQDMTIKPTALMTILRQFLGIPKAIWISLTYDRRYDDITARMYSSFGWSSKKDDLYTGVSMGTTDLLHYGRRRDLESWDAANNFREVARRVMDEIE